MKIKKNFIKVAPPVKAPTTLRQWVESLPTGTVFTVNGNGYYIVGIASTGQERGYLSLSTYQIYKTSEFGPGSLSTEAKVFTDIEIMLNIKVEE